MDHPYVAVALLWWMDYHSRRLTFAYFVSYIAAIHIRLCVIRSWKKNVENAAATKVRKMCAIQNDYSTTTAERYVRESEWIARYWKQILISFSCCYWFPFHLKLNQSDIRPNRRSHTVYNLASQSFMLYKHNISPFSFSTAHFFFSIHQTSGRFCF